MNIILFDDQGRDNLLPLTYTRPCAHLRIGILTIDEKWKRLSSSQTSFLTLDYLSTKFPAEYTEDNLYVNGRILPDSQILSEISHLQLNESIKTSNTLVAYRSSEKLSFNDISSFSIATAKDATDVQFVEHTHDIFSKNGDQIKTDFALITKGRNSAPLSATNTVIGDTIFVEEGVTAEAAVFNTKDGPIYLGKDSTVMEGALIKGPFALGAGSTIKMGAKIYGDTTVGPLCKVGGEVSNTVFHSRSNKGHDGFIGNSVIGEWCNLGADTNCSNLKNNYALVKLWNYPKGRFMNTGLQFCGLIMGDHSKCGINTMFNTGTVVGVSANIFGASFPRNFIPSFTWGGATGFATYTMPKAFETARIVMERRKQELTESEKELLTQIFEESSKQRFWENKPINI